MIQNIINIIGKYGMLLLEGTWGTIWISFVVVLISTFVGALLALSRYLKIKPLTWLINAYVDVIRGTPVLLQLFFFAFGIGPNVPVKVGQIFWVIVALIVNSSAYISEIFRGGIKAVDSGQFEAAQSLGLSEKDMMIKVILPQAIKNILPSLGNECIMMIKETSLASIFYINSLMTSESIISSLTYMKIETLVIVGAIYYILTTVIARIIKRFEIKEHTLS